MGEFQGTGLINSHGEEWLPLSLALIGSAVVTIAVTALVMRLLSKRLDGKGLEEGEPKDA